MVVLLLLLGVGPQQAFAKRAKTPRGRPSIDVLTPSSGATLSGVTQVAGTADDNEGITSVEVAVDDGAFTPATGTTAWTIDIDTQPLSDAPHVISARAIDTNGLVSTASVIVDVLNGSTTHLVTPEGLTIDIAPEVTGWTAQQIYDILKPSAYQLDLLGPSLTIKVQTQYPSSATTSAGTSGGVYTNFKAIIYLDARSTAGFGVRPDYTVAHEYGHAWTLYHYYLTHQGDWTPYLQVRGLVGDPRLGSTYSWTISELIADDYRMLFGSPAAVSQANYINRNLTDPRSVPGLRDWFTTTWA
jgi:hypothetical protein